MTGILVALVLFLGSVAVNGVTITFSAVISNGFGDASGEDLAAGSLVQLGTYDAATGVFTPIAQAFIGDGFAGNPAGFTATSGNLDTTGTGLNIAGKQVAFRSFNGADDTAPQLGIFYLDKAHDPGWAFIAGDGSGLDASTQAFDISELTENQGTTLAPGAVIVRGAFGPDTGTTLFGTPNFNTSAAVPWLLTMDITNSDNPVISFGMLDGATASNDGMDIVFAPASPPGTGPGSAYLSHEAIKYIRDTRPIAVSAEWILVAEPNGVDMELTWDVADIPAEKYISVYEVDDNQSPLAGAVIVLNESESLVISGESRRYFRLRYASDFSVLMTLSPGWNLISVPLQPTDQSPASVFDSAIPGAIWGWSDRAFHPVGAVEALDGYWVFAEDPAGTVVVNGLSPPGNAAVDFDAGWNLWGPAASIDVVYPVGFPVVGVIWEWKGKKIRKADKLEPGKGYWTYSSADAPFINN